MIPLLQILLPTVLVLLLLQPLSAAEPRETKQVLVLYREDKAHPAHELTDQGIRTTFRSNKRFNVQLYSEYLDRSPWRRITAGVIVRDNAASVLESALKKTYVTLAGPGGKTIDVKVRDPKNLDKVKVGDQVVITYTQAFAIALNKPKKK